MSDADVQNATAEMTLGKGLGIYSLCVVSLVLMITFTPFVVPFVAYFIFGFMLNRVVLRGLIQWHPVYNTIDNVASGKIRALVFWPISYLMLFFKLGVIRHL